jgi:hypothetical protein
MRSVLMSNALIIVGVVILALWIASRVLKAKD